MSSRDTISESEELLPFHVKSIPKSVAKKCEEELNETPDKKTKALQDLRSMLQRNRETTGIRFHDDFLSQFLRRNKYRMTDTYQNVQNFVIINRKESFLFKSVPDQYLHLPSSKVLVLLPKRCPDGCTIVKSQIGKWNPREIPFEHFQSLLAVMFVQLLRDPMTQINGFKIIHDFKDTSIHLLKFCSPRNLQLLYHGAINCAPARYKQIHFVNDSIVLKTLWAILKPFLSEKIRNRVVFHSSPEGLLDYFPRSVLPTEYGGTLRESDTEDFLKTANKYHEEYTIEGQPNFY
ncbi:unnamed protein product [Larinioides sclopetarius]|uniref:CRAL-TRIO domain-containing protein n=1 Tax=Larinioides sclopetarius TaxID=280406 RepID=A0AAV1ZW58_9ARAC